jgi:hypothetical protein
MAKNPANRLKPTKKGSSPGKRELHRFNTPTTRRKFTIFI